MQTKRCSKCGQVKAVEEFSKNKSTRDGLCYVCKKCHAEYHKKNKDKVAGHKAEYRKKNKDKIAVRDAEYHKKNKDKIKKREKERRRKLPPRYIKQVLNCSGISDEQITPELIEAKRQQIQLHRLIKECKNVVNRTGN